jgi:hypothetical protein
MLLRRVLKQRSGILSSVGAIMDGLPVSDGFPRNKCNQMLENSEVANACCVGGNVEERGDMLPLESFVAKR